MLLPLPAHPHPCERREEVRIAKTPYARFDRNNYSVPWRYTNTLLTLWASEERIKIFAGETLLAEHERSYASQQRITDDRHLAGMYEHTPGAAHLQGRERVLQALPESAPYLEFVYAQQGRTSRAVELIEALLAKYGHASVGEAIQKAMAAGRHDFWFLRTATQRAHLNLGAPPALPLYLPDRDGLKNLSVETRDLACYDQLATEPTKKEEEP